jgi:anti-sigma factor RsiW
MGKCMDMQHEGCGDLLAELSDYLDGEASAMVCAEIEGHIAGCEDCRVVVDTLRKTVQLYRRLPQPSLSRGATERLYRSLDLTDYLG